jgi:hypothetical protein
MDRSPRRRDHIHSEAPDPVRHAAIPSLFEITEGPRMLTKLEEIFVKACDEKLGRNQELTAEELDALHRLVRRENGWNVDDISKLLEQ